MSERMIELARARMNLPPPSKHSMATMNAVNGGSGGTTSSSRQSQAAATASPQAAAASAMSDEDASLARFLHLLEDSSTSSSGVASSPSDRAASGAAALASGIADEGAGGGSSTASSFTTVPPSLSRRVLNTQGVGFLDGSVAAVTSIAADRFLATVLSQGAACRNRRVRGEDVRRRERKELRDYRKRRRSELRDIRGAKEEDERRRREANITIIEANRAIHAAQRQTGGSAKGKATKKSKKESAAAAAAAATAAHKAMHDAISAKAKMENGGKKPGGGGVSLKGGGEGTQEHKPGESYRGGDDADEVDFLSDGDSCSSSSSSDDDLDADDENDEEEEERRYVLHLRDVVLPLEAWGISLAGKASLCPTSATPRRDDEGDRKKIKGGQVGDDAMQRVGQGSVDGAPTAAVAGATSTVTSPKDEERSPPRGASSEKRNHASTDANK